MADTVLSSTCRSGSRANSRKMLVTKTQLPAIALAAISASFERIGGPCEVCYCSMGFVASTPKPLRGRILI